MMKSNDLGGFFRDWIFPVEGLAGAQDTEDGLQ
jgi:hypothetical protein